jgi:glycosyltransferase involved in cell wall biosynthesis
MIVNATSTLKTSLIISTYNWPEALDLVLKSLLSQSVMPGEVIVADDGSRKETAQLIARYQPDFHVPLIHEWHEDKGFRKTIILNKALKRATGDYIIQVDGDIILHKDFIRDHVANATCGFFIKGSRGRLTEKKSKKILRTKQTNISSLEGGIQSRINATHLPLLSPLFFKDDTKTRNIKGCNFAFWKDDMIAVNGYNNDLKGWGHEDIEFPARLVNYGIKRRQLKMTAVCYHIYHKLVSRNSEDTNLKVYEEVIEKKIVRCANGYDQA